jgi:diguanylate cyclase (GGDEF)-like protein
MFDDSTKKFQLGLVYIFAILAAVGVSPFIVLRYLNGQPLHALLDLSIVIIAISSAAYSYWRGEATQATLYFAAGFYTSGAIIVVYLNNPIFVFWMFPTIVANFFLLRPNSAVLLNIIAVGLTVPIAWKLGKTLDSFAMMSSLFFCSAMAYLFARLTEQQKKRLEIFASQDPLTMLGNRRLMDQELRLCVEDFTRHATPATLIVFDLDNFKAINDKFGHSAGDQLLVRIGEMLNKRLRVTDRAFRFGGEEFVLLARTTNLENSVNIAEQIRQQIMVDIAGPDGHITASFGCASIHPNESREHWFIRADNAMYQAKAQGRNCVVLANEEPAAA